MNSIKKMIKIIIVFVLLYGFGTAGIDYFRMKSGKVPVFNKTWYQTRSKTQYYKGFFYQASRKVTTSTLEPLEESNELQFQLFTLKFSIPSTWKEKKENFSIEVTPQEICDSASVLYYADLDVKVYTYCLDDVLVKKDDKQDSFLSYLKKDSSILKDALAHLSYAGTVGENGLIQVFQDKLPASLSVYQCNNENISDIYITPSSASVMPDFCTYKDDDFRFIFEIEDNSDVLDESTISSALPEVIYQDEKYVYQFDYPKSNYIYLKTPAVRGKVESKIPLMTALQNGLVTIDDLIDKGLKINKVEIES